MTAKIIDGNAIAGEIRAGLKQRVSTLCARGVTPGLAAILVGDNPASQIYVDNKIRACGAVGVYYEVHRLGADCGQEALLDEIARLNADPRIHGILLQLPLPRHLDANRILQSIAIAKDVDGFNWHNLGALVAGHAALAPCTPLGVMMMLDHAGVNVEGRHAVVVGRSLNVGRPMALMLITRGATVSVCNSKTRNLAEITSSADILVVAVGKPGLITASMIKPGAVVIDVGINRLPDGKVVGDVDFAAASRVASRITPVPGGVGPMTVAMLIVNTVTAAERSAAGA